MHCNCNHNLYSVANFHKPKAWTNFFFWICWRRFSFKSHFHILACWKSIVYCRVLPKNLTLACKNSLLVRFVVLYIDHVLQPKALALLYKKSCNTWKNRILLLRQWKKKRDTLCTLGHSANWVRLERRTNGSPELCHALYDLIR